MKKAISNTVVIGISVKKTLKMRQTILIGRKLLDLKLKKNDVDYSIDSLIYVRAEKNREARSC